MPFFGVPIRNGLPIGLGSVAGFGVQQFDPSQLFSSGAEGVWYDPSDTSTLFQDPAGTTPVTAVEQPVGLMLDKSKGLVLGPELVTNGGPGFTTTTGWGVTSATVAANNGKLDCLKTGASPAVFWTLTTVIGTWYKVNIVWENVDATSPSILVNSTGGLSITTTNTNATVYFCAVATSTFAQMQLGSGGVGTGTRIISLSTKTIVGNHAISYNSTTARPTLSARVNLLVATATLSTQSVTTQATSYTLSFAGAGSITLSGTATGSYNAGTHTITCTAGTLTLTVSGAVTTADLRPANSGALLPAYQAVVNANTYDTNGFPKYLYFAGVDDGMSTPANLNLTSTDKVAVFAGVRKLSDAAFGIVAETSPVVDTNNGAMAIGASIAAAQRWVSALRGTSLAYYEPATYAAPVTNVLATSFDIAGAGIASEIVPRVNGVVEQDNPVGASAGTGNFGSYPLYIGARNNASAWFNGYLYGLIIAGSAVSAGNISATEQWVAGKTGIVIP